MQRFILWVGLTFLLFGCSNSISKDITKDIVQSSGDGHLAGVVKQGLIDASWNLDQAVIVGALDAKDPAPLCFRSILGQLGIDPNKPPTPGESFSPRVSDGISAGSVLYIRVQQAKRLQGGGVQAPSDCTALVGMFFMDAARAGIKSQPGGGLLPNFLR